MRQPAITKGTRGLQQALTRSVPAPVGGWNARDPISAMPATDAVLLENWFPRAASVELRPGAYDHATGFATSPRTFVPYLSKIAAQQKLFVSTAFATYNVTSGGAIGAPALNFQLQAHANVTTAGGSFLFASDPTGGVPLQIYNGATWSAAAVTGMAGVVCDIAVLKQRVWFAVRGSAEVYYLPVGAISGAVTAFPLGQVFQRGGSVLALGNWTIDGGDGQDDYVVFVSTEGEVALYKGIDPSTSATFSLVGVYYIGEPLKEQCLTKFGGDLLYLSRAGLFPLSKALLASSVNYRSALTGKIDSAFDDAVAKYAAPGPVNNNWSVCVFPAGSLLLINIPVTSTYSVQYVMNTITGAWTTFSGWPASSFVVFQEELFFAGVTSVAKAWVGTSDFGANITGRAQQAYSPLGAPGKNKHVSLLRPILELGESTEIRYSLSADYAPAVNYSLVQLSGTSYDLWGSGVWGVALWGGFGSQVIRNWATAFAREGFVFSMGMQLSTNKSTVKWISTDFAYTVGKVL